MFSKDTIKIEREYAHDLETVFDAWTNGDQLVNWYSAGHGWTTPHATFEKKIGGRVNIGFKDPEDENSFDLLGTITDIDQPNFFSYLIDPDPQDSKKDQRRVAVSFEGNNEKTNVILEFEIENQSTIELEELGWSAIADNLTPYLKDKSPLR